MKHVEWPLSLPHKSGTFIEIYLCPEIVANLGLCIVKVCVITDEISSDPETAIELALEWGIRHFEIRGLWGRRVPDVEPPQQERLKKLLTQYGVDVVAISPGLFKVNVEDEGSVKDHLAHRLPRSIELAKSLGTNLLIIFGFIGKRESYDEYFDWVVDTLRRAADYAEKENMVLALENEPICLADTGERTAKLVEAIQRENFLVNWDPCNAYHIEEHPFPNGYRKVRDLITHVHLKDCITDKESGRKKYVPIGEGEVGLRDQIRALKSDAYHGFVSIETHFAPRVKGTRECWEGLLRILKEMGEKPE